MESVLNETFNHFNFTIEESHRFALESHVQNLMDSWRYHSRVKSPWMQILILSYSILILFGSLGNLIVIYVVIRNARMRTARNVLIVNLAISDLMLCLITMPLTLVEILYITWQFGNIEIGCRLVGLLQGTSVFVSTFTITAIAIDRRRLIVRTEQESPEDLKKILSIIPIIWIIALFFASPLAIWKNLEDWTGWTENIFTNDDLTCTSESEKEVSFSSNTSFSNSSMCILKELIFRRFSELKTCTEVFPTFGRILFSFQILLIQFLLPFCTLFWSYSQICKRLQLRLDIRVRQIECKNCSPSQNSFLLPKDEKRYRHIIKMRRTIQLLMWIGAIFCICWLPLNILNAVLDSTNLGAKMSESVYCGVYAVCHVLSMLSACANPVIYGFLNENFSKEFKLIANWWKNTLCSSSKSNLTQ